VAAQKRNKAKPRSELVEEFSPKRNNSDFLQRAQRGSLDLARRRILEYGAGADFRDLVSGNCEPHLLLILLADLIDEDVLALDTWKGRFGFARRERNSVTKRLRASANDLERLERNLFLYHAAWPSFKTRLNPVQLREYVRSIPDLLRTFADAVDRAAKHPSSRPRKHTFSNAAMAQFVAYVVACTGKPHDAEVSALVNAVRNQEDRTYCADDQKTWRNEHKAAIHHASQLFPSLFGSR
jgi:hypothetical protein